MCIRDRVRRGFEFHHQAWLKQTATGASEIARWILAELGLSDPAVESRLAEEFAHAALAGQVKALDGARATLAQLAARGIPRALICDTGFSPGKVVRQLLDRHDLLELLPVQIFSNEVGVPKPCPEIFEAALQGLGVEADSVIHVGDLKRTDVAGARAQGIASVRIRADHDDRSELPEADRIVDNHAELQAILEVL